MLDDLVIMLKKQTL